VRNVLRNVTFPGSDFGRIQRCIKMPLLYLVYERFISLFTNEVINSIAWHHIDKYI